MTTIDQLDISFLEHNLNYQFNNLNLLEEALSHPSLKQQNRESINYEKLELLGDAVLGFIVTELIYCDMSHLSEGDMAKIKAYLVSKEVIASVAKQLNISAFMLMTNGEIKSGGRENINNLENTMEALIAALYLDSDISKIKNIIKKLWSPHFAKISTRQFDPKSTLQELAHIHYGVTPLYEVMDRSGPAHLPEFTVKAIVQNLSAIAEATSIKQAEKKAAELLIKKIKNSKKA